MNSAANVSDGAVAMPEQAISFHDWHMQNYASKGYIDPDTFVGRLANFFDGIGTRERQEYQTYLDNINNRNEARAVQSARAWEAAMSNSSYSRAFEDLDRYGVNPYILLNSGSSPSTAVGSSSKPSYSFSKPGVKGTSSNNSGRNLALLMLAIARIAAALQRRWTDRPLINCLV